MKIQDAFDIAADTMKPYFSLAEAKPNVLVDSDAKTMHYRFDSRAIVSNVPRADYDDPHAVYVVGEEVGHFLHHKCNTELIERFRSIGPDRRVDIMNMSNFLELVGRYSGLVYLEHEHGAAAAKSFNSATMANDDLKFRALNVGGDAWRLLEKFGGSGAVLDTTTHITGYRAGSRLYERKGDARLNELSHMPFEEALWLISTWDEMEKELDSEVTE